MRPKIIISCGDPNGIGPEIILKLFSKGYFSKENITVTGPKHVFDYYSSRLRIRNIPDESLINLGGYEKFKVRPGLEHQTAGRISGDAVRIGASLCITNHFQGLVTMPISKKALNSGGYCYNGHTEMLAKISGRKHSAMLLCSDKINAATLTTHIPLKKVSDKITKKFILEKVIMIRNELIKRFSIRNPKIAILSVNPHSGDGGITGTEDRNVLGPALMQLKKSGVNISGPYPADGFFGHIKYKNFDITIGIYHDQIMIPFKIIADKRGVNYTAGLPFIRTSPAHGTAFDIAGRNKADIESTIEAVKLAIKTSKKV